MEKCVKKCIVLFSSKVYSRSERSLRDFERKLSVKVTIADFENGRNGHFVLKPRGFNVLAKSDIRHAKKRCGYPTL